VHKLFIAARNWLARIGNLQKSFCQQSSRQKTQLKNIAAAEKLSCFLGAVAVKFVNIFRQ
jgi:hypothetical protein